MSLFKKPRKNIRRRMGSNDEDDEFSEETPANSVVVGLGDEENRLRPSEAPSVEVKAPRIIKEKKKEKSKKTVLSFEEDLHEGDDGEVFKVKKSSQSKKMMKLIDRERKKKKEVKLEEVSVEAAMEVPAPAPAPAVLNGRAAEMAGVGDLSSDEEERHPKFSRPSHVKLLLERGHIPDAAMIHAARKRRQQARDNGADFIPIASARNKPEDKSRLVREDDASDEEEERIEMEVNKMAKERERRRETFLAAQDDSDKREEDEWESQQIRKGVTGAQLAAVQHEALYSMYSSPVHVLTPLQPEEVILERKTEVSTPEEVLSRLRERLSCLKSASTQRESERDRLVADLLSTNSDRARLESEAPALAQRFRLYQELRGYVTDLVECLDEKVPVIEALEQRVLALLRRRADDMTERRRQDVRDLSDDLAPSSRSGMKRVDELRVRRAAEREGRRTRRRRAREAAKGTAGGGGKHQEGMSSDDEMTEVEVAAFRTQMQQVAADRRLVFADVTEDFSSVREVSKRFERWRRQDWCAYQEAYVSLCLPKVLGPIIRLELVAWSPLEDGQEMERCDWFDALTQYGLGGSEEESQLREDPDLLLIPRLVEKMMLPKMLQVVEAQWDPVSTSQTLRLVGLLNRLIADYPSLLPTSRPLAQLLKLVVDKMRVAVDQDVFIPLYPKSDVGRSSGAATAFCERQFGCAVKLLRNFLAWHGLLSDSVLQEVGLGALLNRYLLTAVRNCEPADAAAKCNMIASTFPRWWFQPSTCVAQLQAFVAQVRHIVTLLDVSSPAVRDLAERLSHIANSLQSPTL